MNSSPIFLHSSILPKTVASSSSTCFLSSTHCTNLSCALAVSFPSRKAFLNFAFCTKTFPSKPLCFFSNPAFSFSSFDIGVFRDDFLFTLSSLTTPVAKLNSSIILWSSKSDSWLWLRSSRDESLEAVSSPAGSSFTPRSDFSTFSDCAVMSFRSASKRTASELLFCIKEPRASLVTTISSGLNCFSSSFELSRASSEDENSGKYSVCSSVCSILLVFRSGISFSFSFSDLK